MTNQQKIINIHIVGTLLIATGVLLLIYVPT